MSQGTDAILPVKEVRRTRVGVNRKTDKQTTKKTPSPFPHPKDLSNSLEIPPWH